MWPNIERGAATPQPIDLLTLPETTNTIKKSYIDFSIFLNYFGILFFDFSILSLNIFHVSISTSIYKYNDVITA